jgi:hypothetical protein
MQTLKVNKDALVCIIGGEDVEMMKRIMFGVWKKEPLPEEEITRACAMTFYKTLNGDFDKK